MCVNRGPGTLESDVSLKRYMPIYGLFFHLITFRFMTNDHPSELLSDVYSVCFRITFPESLTQF